MATGTETKALSEIRAIVGEKGIVDDAADQPGYLIDERRLYEGKAALIVRPANVDEVSRVMKVCFDAGIGVVPQGGNTGYCGGATPSSDGSQVVLSLSRMNTIRGLDPVGHTMTLDAGVILAKAQQAADEAGLLFPLSMGSEGSCQIGGNLSTNAGGLAVLRYGTARELTLGLEVVLPDGEIIDGLTGLRKDNTGLDLKSLFMGAEGTLGVITGAVVKLFPAIRTVETAWLAVADPDAACKLLGMARKSSGDAVSSFEYVSRRSLDLVLQHVEGATDPLGSDGQHFVLMELASPAVDEHFRDSVEQLITDGMEQGLVTDGVLAESGAQRQSLWRLRESVPEAEKLAGGAIKHDISVRISSIPAYMLKVAPQLADLAAPYQSVYGHIGDGNLHYNLLAPEGAEASAWREQWSATLSDCVHAAAAEMGGSFSAEHGVGQLKKGDLERYKNAAALRTMHAMKQAIDPKGIMNPGKIF